MSHSTRSHESRHIYSWVKSHVFMSHITRAHLSCHKCVECIHLHTHTHTHAFVSHETCHANEWVGHVINVNASHHTHQWVMSRISMSHDPRMNESAPHVTHIYKLCPTYQWVMSCDEPTRLFVRHDSWLLTICWTWLVDMCDVTQSYLCHDSLICVCDMRSRLVHHMTIDMTHRYDRYVLHDSFICVA